MHSGSDVLSFPTKTKTRCSSRCGIPEKSVSLDPGDLTSHWPEGGTAMPKPAVAAITGFRRP